MKKQTEINNTEKAGWLLLIGIVLIGANLRVPITSVGTLMSFIREDLDISNAVAGLVTTLPLIAFAILSPFAPKIANRIGMQWTIALSMVVLIIGIAIRSVTGIGFLFIGTLLIGLAISIGNVLIPGIIKMNFPYRIGVMTGIYAVFMNIFGALGSGLSVPISGIGDMGWQGALGIWGLLAIVAFVVWLPQLRKQQRASPKTTIKPKQKTKLWRSPLAWSVTLFMGGQSLMFYTLIAWMPDILNTIGYDARSAGWMVFLMQAAIIPTTFVVPVIAVKLKNQVGFAIGTALLFMTGFSGLLFGSAMLVPLCAVLLGIAGGSGFSLSMVFFTLRTKDAKEAVELSGMAQSFGYMLAAVGPVFAGVLYDIGGGWTLPLLFLLFISIIILLAGIVSGKEGTIAERAKKSKKELADSI
ncbi:CynX/NimT family MFS transporter [Planococcus halocryophilus]|uniref:CynX/NimT family MFS transporter n=1 Tax=Planococcus halocryophilus TaxID=1215089 RepID=UPI001F1179DC|nr:MFS transporter [Planococcus halocryophilus]MCH4825320.1 MFS transporter [Planococcus halocryophilus]